MINIVYFSPSPPSASGGVKVIYRHAASISAMRMTQEISASVYHFENVGSKCRWYDEEVPLKLDNVLISSRDFVVLPEHHLYDYWRKFSRMGIRYGIFVQNAYLIGGVLSQREVQEAFDKASLIITISEDSKNYVNYMFPEVAGKVVPLRWSINSEIFLSTADVWRTISYMPRRMYDHAKLVCGLVESRLPPKWKIIALDRLTERQVAAELRHSSIFMSFSGLEGLPLPPVEAALCGNRVVGYHGQGGLEYWDPALFRTVECGDIQGFARAVLEEVEGIERLAKVGRSSADETQETARELLRRRYSPERETQLLAQFAQRVVELMGSSSATSQ